MEDRLVNLIIGSLLHDIGKVVYRTGEMKKHSKLGWDFLSTIESFKGNNDIKECVLYHHGRELSKANLDDDSLAFITYVADNISAASDRRDDVIEGEDYEQSKAIFDKSAPLASVFNVLNRNNSKKYDDHYYKFKMTNTIGYPIEQKVGYTTSNYLEVKIKIKEQLQGTCVSQSYINSIIHLLETTTSFIPSSTNIKELMDISLFDHSKTTAAIASCLYYYLDSNNYKKTLFTNEKEFREENAFLLYSCDISGIQNYIYTINGTDALKSLRARSLYLELLLENIVDELLYRLGLSRCNLIYTGGGHAYLLLPNTQKVKDGIMVFDKELKSWFLDEFDISLYIASGFAQCNSNELSKDIGKVYERVGKNVAQNKAQRYSANDIIKLNSSGLKNEERECVECRKSGLVNDNGRCKTCQALIDISPMVAVDDTFFIIKEKPKEDTNKTLPLPFNQVLTIGTIDEARNSENVRVYSKNKPSMGYGFSTNIWVGDYTAKTNVVKDNPKIKRPKTFEEFAKDAKGINRIAVLRADVDNLGRAFILGFKEQEDGEIVSNSKLNYETISRTTTLSRQLSMFFKYYINDILKNRNALVVYSGGDDMFIVGGWDDVIDLSNDLRQAFIKYTQGRLTISAGIGVYPRSYPISRIAYEVGELESAAKVKDEYKNKVTLFSKGQVGSNEKLEQDWVLSWEQLPNMNDANTNYELLNPITQKLQILRDVFDKGEQHGKAFLYKMLELLRESNDKINVARYAYLLSRAKENNKNLDVKQFYKWIQTKEERKELEIAITLYSYETRDK